ncbi:M48 family metalloprotease [Endozoicomonas sp. ONNA2]|uniref:M48 family metalloprotease n=1 Tax=Endozoicomonas sp. ONNA2 TaxID=2828741 RepID=UPI002148CD3E|nr:M48 family metalloprotease [Endozoicomonas sp. ONNA2]
MNAFFILVIAMGITGCTSVQKLSGLEDKSGPLITNIKSDWPEENTSSASTLEPEKSVVEWRARDRTVVRIDRIEKQLNKRLEVLLKQVPEFPLQPRVYVSTSGGFSAEALSDGGIFIPVGVLVQIDYLEELDALLAHELGHFILKHHTSDQVKRWSTNLAGKMGIYYGNILTAIGGNSILDKAIFNLWNESEEKDADKLAIDILIRAGVNPDGMMLAFKKLDQYTKQKNNIRTSSDTLSYGPEEQKKKNEYSLSDLVGFSDRVVGAVSGGLGIASHGGENERATEARAYIRHHYPKRPRTKLTTATFAKDPSLKALFDLNSEVYELISAGKYDKAAILGERAIRGELSENPYTRYVMFQIRSKQGEKKKASYNLKKAYDSPDTPLYVPYTYLLAADKRRDKNETMYLVNKIVQDFDNPMSFMPDQVHFLKKYGYEQASNKVAWVCAGLGDYRYYDKCSKANNGKLYK